MDCNFYIIRVKRPEPSDANRTGLLPVLPLRVASLIARLERRCSYFVPFSRDLETSLVDQSSSLLMVKL